jgi:3-hydroxyacyl-CoA dehydrogenase/enoyl-CoA hydratase/3-hydroxybutyryl-CoA epimerase
VAAAINGTALGTGFELALACHYRVAIDNPKIGLGLPEVNFGLIPSGGGVVRLLWLLGVERAFAILNSGRRLTPREALKLGIIDELAEDRKSLLDKAKQWLLSAGEGRRPWDREGQSPPKDVGDNLANMALSRRLSAQVFEQTQGNYPAPQAALNVLAEGLKVDFDTACRIESRQYTQLLRGRQCKNMIKAFWFDANYIREGRDRPPGYGKFRPRKVGVIGSGIMGSGIALACIRQGLEVVVKDVSRLIAERGRAFVEKRLGEQVAAGAIMPEARERMLERLHTTDDPRDFQECDLVIEAVFENQNVKQKVTREAEAFMDRYALFASNTISIPITRLAEASTRPENYVGLHFFHPADEAPLVEIVRGEKTSDETVARAFDFAQAIRKTPIVVKDDWGFFAARTHNTYLLEGITMLEEGYSPALIENLGLRAGMPKGPLASVDELSLPIALRYEQQAAAHYGAKYIQHPAVRVLDKMLNELGRPGRAKEGGFHEYPPGGGRMLWPALAEHFPNTRVEFNAEEIIERFLFAQVIEAVWCLQEKVILSEAAANLGSIRGWGFPAFTGGVIQYVRDYGPEAFLARCQEYERRFGQRFRPPRLLRRLFE